MKVHYKEFAIAWKTDRDISVQQCGPGSSSGRQDGSKQSPVSASLAGRERNGSEMF